MPEKQQRLAEAWRTLWGQYKAIIDSLDGFLYIVSPDYEIEFVNQQFAQILGHYPLGQQCHRALYGLDRPCPWCQRDQVVKGETVRRLFRHPQDNLTSYRVSTPLFWDGDLFMMVTVQYLPGDIPVPEEIGGEIHDIEGIMTQNVA
jgi:PAS domain-containing protein